MSIVSLKVYRCVLHRCVISCYFYCLSPQAFGAVEAMSDRVCIASKGKNKVHLSAEDMLTCCAECGDGCNGGELEPAWNYWVENGLVSGGNYNSNEVRPGHDLTIRRHILAREPALVRYVPAYQVTQKPQTN